MSDADIAQRVRTHLIRCLHHSLEKLSKMQLVEPVTVRVSDDLHTVLLVVSPAGQCASCPQELECRNHPPDTESDSVRARIIRHLNSEPQSRQRVARLAGCRFNSHFHQVIADLIREKLVMDGPDGIRLNDLRT